MPALSLLLAACSTTPGSHGGQPGGGSSSGGGAAGSSSGASGGSGSGGATMSSSGASSGGGTSGATGAGSGSSGSPGGNSGGSTSAEAGAGSGGADGGGSGPVGATIADAGAGGVCPTLPTAPVPASSIIQFNDNGGWSWYQDERALVDTAANKLIIGSVASGGTRDGNIEATIYDLATKQKTTSKLGNLSIDDHDAPAFAIRPDGKYVAVWTTHRTDCNTYYSQYSGTSWAMQQIFDWTSLGCPWDGTADAATKDEITYSNVWYMSAENRLYDIARSVNTSPNALSSTDNGQTWSYYGRLTTTPQMGYVAGYYKYWGNGKDRIDFLGTEAHPRDFDNSLYHGYVTGNKIYNSTGTVIDSSFSGTTAPADAMNINLFTPVFTTGTTIHGVKLEHAWNHDLVRYDDGTIAAIWQARVNGTGTTDPDKRFLYARFDGTSWKLTYLVKGGHKLYSSEEDYTGLGALDPDNPHVIYVSTTTDPRDDTTDLGKHEIWMGVTCDNGATFKWAPITQNSTVDNLRPIVPKWDANHTALLWLKGTYTSAQSYNFQVVGTITGP
ncbi:MAG: BNR-4 repeat-containing protein [Myxococcales bacterium]|nr:BNR-4 repeat-containing protein [Myxococcales bacterium]